MGTQGKRHQWHDHWSIHTTTSNGYDGSPATPEASDTFVAEGEKEPTLKASGAGITPAAPTPAHSHYRVGVEPTRTPRGVVASTHFAQRLSARNQLGQSRWNKDRQLPVLARYPPKDFIRANDQLDQLCQAPHGPEGAVPHAYMSHTSPEAHQTHVSASHNHPALPPHLRSRPLPASPQDSTLRQGSQSKTNGASSSTGSQVLIDTVDCPIPASHVSDTPPHLRGTSRALPPAPRSRDIPTASPCLGTTGANGQNGPVSGQNIPSAFKTTFGTETASRPLQSSGAALKTHRNFEHRYEPAVHERRQKISNETKYQGGNKEVIRKFPPEFSPVLLKQEPVENARAPGWKPTGRPEIRPRRASSASTHRSTGSELVFEDAPIVPPGMGREASTYDPTTPPDLRWGIPTEQPVEQDWNVTRRPRGQVIQSDPELSGSIDSEGNFRLHLPTFLRRWIFSWLQGVPEKLETSFLEETDHWRCDVDTFSGCSIPPILYPESKTSRLPNASLQTAFLTHNRPS